MTLVWIAFGFVSLYQFGNAMRVRSIAIRVKKLEEALTSLIETTHTDDEILFARKKRTMHDG